MLPTTMLPTFAASSAPSSLGRPIPQPSPRPEPKAVPTDSPESRAADALRPLLEAYPDNLRLQEAVQATLAILKEMVAQ